ncbi:coiled-coil domain protein [Fusarium tjaetaba]|uniref:Coiled-coil domain protein n=1 Tax=Fusarium tjaetaba TaxID=1567544 RepID=A0A8H5RJ48_9HYPO|nr:coiled-coil domain protein [Fusarium tjaetaba]KAF5635651.1 coiled-coil domain protein [Fusarium tjaetaba]
MSSKLNSSCPPLEGDRQEERPSTSPWLAPSRIINFNNKNWVSVPEEILKNHPAFLACWKGQQTLVFPAAPYHVAHVLLHYIHKGEYRNLKVHGTYQESCVIDFSTAIYAYKIGIKYQLPELSRLAAERTRIYGGQIAFPEMTKRLSSPPFNNMELQGVLRSYLCSRITREGTVMSTESRAEIEKFMGSTMIAILYQSIARLEREADAEKDRE